MKYISFLYCRYEILPTQDIFSVREVIRATATSYSDTTPSKLPYHGSHLSRTSMHHAVAQTYSITTHLKSHATISIAPLPSKPSTPSKPAPSSPTVALQTLHPPHSLTNPLPPTSTSLSLHHYYIPRHMRAHHAPPFFFNSSRHTREPRTSVLSCITNTPRIPMRPKLSHIFRRISRSLPHANTTAPAQPRHPSPPPRYSSIVGSQGRLVVEHPDPTSTTPTAMAEESASLPQHGAAMRCVSAPESRARKRCAGCARRLEGYEFPARVPTGKCRHGNNTCAYCLHNVVYAAFEKGAGWKEVQCPECGEGVSEEEGRGLVLVWEVKGG
jgi:hypothetical protein